MFHHNQTGEAGARARQQLQLIQCRPSLTLIWYQAEYLITACLRSKWWIVASILSSRSPFILLHTGIWSLLKTFVPSWHFRLLVWHQSQNFPRRSFCVFTILLLKTRFFWTADTPVTNQSVQTRLTAAVYRLMFSGEPGRWRSVIPAAVSTRCVKASISFHQHAWWPLWIWSWGKKKQFKTICMKYSASVFTATHCSHSSYCNRPIITLHFHWSMNRSRDPVRQKVSPWQSVRVLLKRSVQVSISWFWWHAEVWSTLGLMMETLSLLVTLHSCSFFGVGVYHCFENWNIRLTFSSRSVFLSV